MGVAHDLVLLTTDPQSGKSYISSTVSDAVLGGALMLDLIAAERLAVNGEGRHARVQVLDKRPLGKTLLDDALGRLASRKPQKPASAVTRLGKRAQREVYAELTEQRAVAPRVVKILGLFPTTRHDVLDTRRRNELVSSVKACLLRGTRPDDVTGPLIALLSAADLVKPIVGKRDAKPAKARAKKIAAGDGSTTWASKGVREAVQATNAAVAAGVAASVAATSGTGGG
ncbi:GPP34 family phosphoprotein [Hoyosella sp. G463]|uniref:GPP34 family phosphoprotein n=1 Tax=Lolliginicoccus lacisalsi TaxID=2742202 RepID=A0A927J9L4_9ACTN|nr:GPP34 family phosphoprotein [Lolliginicoccus lacisalsi]MBD8505060.1 GPP34 family phosphoprotein [Lolliginicoccus lacisalsi]